MNKAKIPRYKLVIIPWYKQKKGSRNFFSKDITLYYLSFTLIGLMILILDAYFKDLNTFVDYFSDKFGNIRVNR